MDRGCETVGDEIGAERGEKGIKAARNDKNDRFWARSVNLGRLPSPYAFAMPNASRRLAAAVSRACCLLPDDLKRRRKAWIMSS